MWWVPIRDHLIFSLDDAYVLDVNDESALEFDEVSTLAAFAQAYSLLWSIQRKGGSEILGESSSEDERKSFNVIGDKMDSECDVGEDYRGVIRSGVVTGSERVGEFSGERVSDDEAIGDKTEGEFDVSEDFSENIGSGVVIGSEEGGEFSGGRIGEDEAIGDKTDGESVVSGVISVPDTPVKVNNLVEYDIILQEYLLIYVEQTLST